MFIKQISIMNGKFKLLHACQSSTFSIYYPLYSGIVRWAYRQQRSSVYSMSSLYQLVNI